MAFLARRILAGRDGRGGEGRGRRYLRGAVLGVALSLVPLVVVLVVADGMIEGITARYIETGTYHLQALPLQRGSLGALDDAAASLRALPGLLGAFPEMQGPAVAVAGEKSSGAAIRAVDPAFLDDPGTAAYLRLVSGERRLSAGNEVLLGEALARSLGAGPGDLVSLVTARPGREGPGAYSPRVTPFRVRGVVSAGYRELDALWAFVTIKAGFRIMAPETSRVLVGVKVERPFGNLDAYRRAMRAALRPEWAISTWPEAERNLFRSFSTTRALLLLVMALTVAVAAINVGSSLVMLVLERRRDIAVLKSTGASNSFVGRVFLLAGLATGGTGTALGLGVGAAAAWRVNDLIALIEGCVNAVAAAAARLAGTAAPLPRKILDPSYYLERIPVRIDAAELLAVAALSLALCALASLLPARRAARLPPLEIFRKT